MFFSLQGIAIPLCILLVLPLLWRKSARRQRLPPGPPPIPLLGNVLGVDTRHPWKTYAKWGKEYGDVIYTRLLTQDIVVLNSDKVVQELLEKRSHNYSCRPASLASMTEFMGTGFISFLLPYNDSWRLHRRFFHQAFHLTAAVSFQPVQLRKTHDFLMRLLSTPRDFSGHINLLSSSLIMAIVYDYHAADSDDPILRQLQHATEIAEHLLRPEIAAVLAAFPLIKRLPEWFPGAGFKRKALMARRLVPEWVDAPFEYVKRNVAAGTAAPSMVSDVLSRAQDEAKTEAEAVAVEKDVKEACATAYAAAAETTYSTLLVFFLVMALYPDVQAKAQAEIDSVIGEGLPRLPDWGDRSSLPYVDAVVKETLRWYPAVPLGIPHATVDDDIYEGYYIPKGATVVANTWAISRDPTKFPEPEKFKPERFLETESPAVHELSLAFGYGRRVCVGRYVADSSLWIAVVSLLAVFRFEAAPSWDPGPDGANVKWAPGVTTRPEELPCEITPRHKNLNSERLSHLIELAAL